MPLYRHAAPQVTSVPDGDNRKAFEIAAKAIGYVDEFYFHTNTHPNYYDDDRINDMWNMWNACRAAMLAAPAVQAEQELHKCAGLSEKCRSGENVQKMQEPVSQPYMLPVGWIRADYQDENSRGDAPLFVLGKKDPQPAWGVAYMPLSNSPVIPDGYALVPVEPTKEMIDAGWSYYMTTKSPSSLGVYGAMLAAAPKQEAE